MSIRPLIALMLIALLTLSTMGQTLIEQDETLAQTSEQERLTTEEEREARALAEEFFKRLEQAQDVTPLVKELYVSDFVARMQQDDMASRSQSLRKSQPKPRLTRYFASTRLQSMSCISLCGSTSRHG